MINTQTYNAGKRRSAAIVRHPASDRAHRYEINLYWNGRTQTTSRVQHASNLGDARDTARAWVSDK